MQLDDKVMVLWDMCSVIDSVQLFVEHAASVFRVYSEDGGRTFLRHVTSYLPYHVASHSTAAEMSHLVLWVPSCVCLLCSSSLKL
jgi:hypothetical protein